MEENNSAYVLRPSKIQDFMLAGNAVFTVQRKANGRHYTYLVKAEHNPRDIGKPLWYVKVKTSNGAWGNIGILFSRPKLSFRFGVGELESVSAKGFKWLVELLEAKDWQTIEKYAVVMHTGMCGKCGRPLTTPESIEIGIGPTCLRG